MTTESPTKPRGRPRSAERDQRPQGTSVYSLLDAPPKATPVLEAAAMKFILRRDQPVSAHRLSEDLIEAGIGVEAVDVLAALVQRGLLLPPNGLSTAFTIPTVLRNQGETVAALIWLERLSEMVRGK